MKKENLSATWKINRRTIFHTAIIFVLSERKLLHSESNAWTYFVQSVPPVFILHIGILNFIITSNTQLFLNFLSSIILFDNKINIFYLLYCFFDAFLHCVMSFTNISFSQKVLHKSSLFSLVFLDEDGRVGHFETMNVSLRKFNLFI